MAKPAKNLIGLEWNELMTAGRNHSYPANGKAVILKIKAPISNRKTHFPRFSDTLT
jgi:hypothetical protein